MPIPKDPTRETLERWLAEKDTTGIWTTGHSRTNDVKDSIRAFDEQFKNFSKDKKDKQHVSRPTSSRLPQQERQEDSENLVQEDSESRLIASHTLEHEAKEPEAVAHKRRIDLDEEIYDTRDHEEISRSPHHPWSTAIWYWLMTVLDPPPFGAYRATYTCGCGKLCYIDVEELVPGGAEELEQEIRKEASLVRCRNPNSGTPSSNNVQTPAPAHLNTSTLPHNGGQGAPIQSLPTLGAQSQTFNTTNTTAQTPAPNFATIGEKYLLLCVNTKRGLTKLMNVDVSTVTNDQFMFRQIRNQYETTRQGHDWNIATFLPSAKAISRSALKLISMLPFPKFRLPQWIAGALQDCRLFIPRKVEFIKFELIPVHLEIYAGNFEKPEIPSVDEVLVKKTYEYEPTTLKAKILNVPIHELLKPGQHLGRYWWKRFPNKLDSPLTYVENLDCYGWGILINEGWNMHFIFVLCFLAMVMFGVFVILYSIFTNDASTGAGIGSFVMAILTLYYTLEYNQWKEQ